MNLNWSNKVIKYVLFIFNLLFVISGIILIAVGVSVKEYYSDYDIFLNNSYFSLPNLLIAIGSLIFFISFFGCCGAIRESWFMIFVFSILLSIIFIMEFSAGIAGYVLRDNTASYLTGSLKDSMAKYQLNQNKSNGPTIMWDTMQRNFKCCGASGPIDWKPKNKISNTSLKAFLKTELRNVGSEGPTATTPTTATTIPTNAPTTPSVSTTASATTSTTTTGTTTATTSGTTTAPAETFDLPFSCCRSKPGTGGQVNCIYNDETTARYYRQGCVDGFGDYLKEHAVTIGGVGIAIALIQLFGVIFACHLTKQLKHGFYST